MVAPLQKRSPIATTSRTQVLDPSHDHDEQLESVLSPLNRPAISPPASAVYSGEVYDLRDIRWQGLLFQNAKSIGALLNPSYTSISSVPDGKRDPDSLCNQADLSVAPGLQQVVLVFDEWRPARGTSAQPLRLPAFGEFKQARFRLQLLGRHTHCSFALPFTYNFSGAEVCAGVDQHVQRVEYCKQQRNKYDGSLTQLRPAAPIWGGTEHDVETGSEWERCTLTFNTESEHPVLQRITLRLTVLQRGCSSTNSSSSLRADGSPLCSRSPSPSHQPRAVLDAAHARSSISGSTAVAAAASNLLLTSPHACLARTVSFISAASDRRAKVGRSASCLNLAGPTISQQFLLHSIDSSNSMDASIDLQSSNMGKDAIDSSVDSVPVVQLEDCSPHVYRKPASMHACTLELRHRLQAHPWAFDSQSFVHNGSSSDLPSYSSHPALLAHSETSTRPRSSTSRHRTCAGAGGGDGSSGADDDDSHDQPPGHHNGGNSSGGNGTGSGGNSGGNGRSGDNSGAGGSGDGGGRGGGRGNRDRDPGGDGGKAGRGKKPKARQRSSDTESESGDSVADRSSDTRSFATRPHHSTPHANGNSSSAAWTQHPVQSSPRASTNSPTPASSPHQQQQHTPLQSAPRSPQVYQPPHQRDSTSSHPSSGSNSGRQDSHRNSHTPETPSISSQVSIDTSWRLQQQQHQPQQAQQQHTQPPQKSHQHTSQEVSAQRQQSSDSGSVWGRVERRPTSAPSVATQQAAAAAAQQQHQLQQQQQAQQLQQQQQQQAQLQIIQQQQQQQQLLLKQQQQLQQASQPPRLYSAAVAASSQQQPSATSSPQPPLAAQQHVHMNGSSSSSSASKAQQQQQEARAAATAATASPVQNGKRHDPNRSEQHSSNNKRQGHAASPGEKTGRQRSSSASHASQNGHHPDSSSHAVPTRHSPTHSQAQQQRDAATNLPARPPGSKPSSRSSLPSAPTPDLSIPPILLTVPIQHTPTPAPHSHRQADTAHSIPHTIPSTNSPLQSTPFPQSLAAPSLRPYSDSPQDSILSESSFTNGLGLLNGPMDAEELGAMLGRQGFTLSPNLSLSTSLIGPPAVLSFGGSSGSHTGIDHSAQHHGHQSQTHPHSHQQLDKQPPMSQKLLEQREHSGALSLSSVSMSERSSSGGYLSAPSNPRSTAGGDSETDQQLPSSSLAFRLPRGNSIGGTGAFLAGQDRGKDSNIVSLQVPGSSLRISGSMGHEELARLGFGSYSHTYPILAHESSCSTLTDEDMSTSGLLSPRPGSVSPGLSVESFSDLTSLPLLQASAPRKDNPSPVSLEVMPDSVRQQQQQQQRPMHTPQPVQQQQPRYLDVAMSSPHQPSSPHHQAQQPAQPLQQQLQHGRDDSHEQQQQLRRPQLQPDGSIANLTFGTHGSATAEQLRDDPRWSHSPTPISASAAAPVSDATDTPNRKSTASPTPAPPPTNSSTPVQQGSTSENVSVASVSPPQRQQQQISQSQPRPTPSLAQAVPIMQAPQPRQLQQQAPPSTPPPAPQQSGKSPSQQQQQQQGQVAGSYAAQARQMPRMSYSGIVEMTSPPQQQLQYTQQQMLQLQQQQQPNLLLQQHQAQLTKPTDAPPQKDGAVKGVAGKAAHLRNLSASELGAPPSFAAAAASSSNSSTAASNRGAHPVNSGGSSSLQMSAFPALGSLQHQPSPPQMHHNRSSGALSEAGSDFSTSTPAQQQQGQGPGKSTGGGSGGANGSSISRPSSRGPPPLPRDLNPNITTNSSTTNSSSVSLAGSAGGGGGNNYNARAGSPKLQNWSGAPAANGGGSGNAGANNAWGGSNARGGGGGGYGCHSQPSTPSGAGAAFGGGGFSNSCVTDIERLLRYTTPVISLPAESVLGCLLSSAERSCCRGASCAGRGEAVREEGTAAAVADLRLCDLWDSYMLSSLHGQEVPTMGGCRGPSHAYFAPYLSGIQLFTAVTSEDGDSTSDRTSSAASAPPAHDVTHTSCASGATPPPPAAATVAVPHTISGPVYVPGGSPNGGFGGSKGQQQQHQQQRMHLRFEFIEDEKPFNRHSLYERVLMLAESQQAPPPSLSTPATIKPPAAPPASSPSPPPLIAPSDPPVVASNTPASEPASTVVHPSPQQPEAMQRVQASLLNSNPSTSTATSSTTNNTSSAAAPDGVDTTTLVPSSPPGSRPPPGHTLSPVAAHTDASASDVQADEVAADTEGADSATTVPNGVADDAHVCAACLARASLESVELSEAAETAKATNHPVLCLRLADLHPFSWYSVAWYPLYRIPDAPLLPRFMTFHNFCGLVQLQSHPTKGPPAIYGAADAAGMPGPAGDAPPGGSAKQRSAAAAAAAAAADTVAAAAVALSSSKQKSRPPPSAASRMQDDSVTPEGQPGAVGGSSTPLQEITQVLPPSPPCATIPAVGLAWYNIHSSERWLDRLPDVAISSSNPGSSATSTSNVTATSGNSSSGSNRNGRATISPASAPVDLRWQAQLARLLETGHLMAHGNGLKVIPAPLPSTVGAAGSGSSGSSAAGKGAGAKAVNAAAREVPIRMPDYDYFATAPGTSLRHLR